MWLVFVPPSAPGVRIETGHSFAVTSDDPEAAEELIDINRAPPSELEALPGIGPVLSQRIVAHREQNGPFRRTDQLMEVDGIGPATFERVHDLVTVGD